MRMSDKYNINGLMEVCRCFLIEKMNINNLYQAVILGHLHNDEILKDAAMQMLVRNDKSVKEIEGWKDLSHYPELALEILDFYSKSTSPSSCEPPPRKRSKLSLDLEADFVDEYDNDK